MPKKYGTKIFLLIPAICITLAVVLDTVSASDAAVGTAPDANAHTFVATTYAGEPESEGFAEALPQAEVLIDAGHGGIDGGTYNGETLEKNINLAIGRLLYNQLREEGIHVAINRCGDYALSDENHWHRSRSRHLRDLSQRWRLTEEIPTGIIVSLHVNWSANRRTSGPLVLYQNEGRSILLAQFIQDSLNSLYGTSYLPSYGKPFYLLKRSRHPAVIVEMGFLSNPDDLKKLENPAEQARIAAAIAAGLRQYQFVFRR